MMVRYATLLFTFLCLVYLHTNTVELCPSLIHCHFTAFGVQTHFLSLNSMPQIGQHGCCMVTYNVALSSLLSLAVQ